MNDYTDNRVQTATEDATFSSARDIEAHKVLRNTYMLLAATLLFSTLVAGIGMVLNMPYMGLWMLLPYIGLLWMVEKNKNNASGIAWVFALTGWLGLTLSPILNFYIGSGAGQTVLLSLGGTAAIFFMTSGYVLVTRKNLSFMGGFLMTGILVAFIVGIASVFLNIPGLGLAVSSMFLLIASGLIMWQTSEIIHGGETNYISATVTLYVMIYNIFLSLLSLIGVSND